MLYRHAVIGFKPTKYTKASPELRRELSEHASDGKQQRRMHMLFWLQLISCSQFVTITTMNAALQTNSILAQARSTFQIAKC